MNPLKKRVEALEKIKPPVSPLDALTDAELDEQLYNHCKTLHELGLQIDLQAALFNIRCREFFADEPWTRIANHRTSVFLEFRGIAIQEKLPEKINVVFARGWKNVVIPGKDISMAVDVLSDAGEILGEEHPWLKGYLECSGVVNESLKINWQYRELDN